MILYKKDTGRRFYTSGSQSSAQVDIYIRQSIIRADCLHTQEKICDRKKRAVWKSQPEDERGMRHNGEPP